MRRLALPTLGPSGPADAAAFLDCGAAPFAFVAAPADPPRDVDALRLAVLLAAAGVNASGAGPLVSGVRFAPAWGGDVTVVT